MALVSVSTYVACGSSDPSNSDQEAGAAGAPGAGGEPSSSGGSKNAAGSKGTAGDANAAGATGSAGGEGGGANAPLGGSGGAAGEAAGGDAGGGDAGGDAAGGAPDDGGLPSVCPGVLSDYTQLDGTSGPDTFTTELLEGKLLVFGLDGDDVFDGNPTGNDCLVGGPGDDDLTNPGESASYLIGGPGADTFHLIAQTNNYALIADMSAEDSIALSKASYGLDGTVGGTVASYQLYSLADYEAGTGSIPAGESAALIYDPATGGIWRDVDRGVKGSSQGDAVQLATVLNHSSYTFNPEDFMLDD